MLKNEFRLNHVVLYAKLWYKHSDDIWADLKKCLTADGYSGDIMRNRDVYWILINQFENMEHRGHAHMLSTVIDSVNEQSCWKFGYVTKGSCFADDPGVEYPEYDISEAIVRYILSHFMQLNREQWQPTRPDFKNVLPPRKGMTAKKVKEFFPTCKTEKV